MRTRWLLAMAMLGSAACSGASEPSIPATLDAAVLVDNVNDPDWPMDAITILSAVLTDEGRLRLSTRYGGGCKDHTAALLVGSGMAKSLPPQMWARLAHDAKDDGCEALVHRTFEFDLKPVRDLYRGGAPTGAGVILLHIDGTSVTYTFE